jgi:hypothetical protein
VRLPPHVRDLLIKYTANGMVAPEKVQFRYTLEGQDVEWRQAVNKREVRYSNLPPGNYRFHVTASNNSGVWNDEGDVLDFSSPRRTTRRTGFAPCVGLFAAVRWAAYQFRSRLLASKRRPSEATRHDRPARPFGF